MRFSWVVGLGMACLVACSGESDTTGDDDDVGGGDTSSWAGACARAAEVLCRMGDECAPLLFGGVIPADCRGFYQSSCLESARLPDVNITASEYVACVNAFERLSCDDWLYNGESPPECRNVPGERPAGDPCGSGLQCASGACTVGVECGVCEVRAAEGESCLERDCDASLICDVDGFCRPRTRLGEPCSPGAPCDILMNCRGGVCNKPPGEGEPCATDGLTCDLYRVLICNPTTLLCESESVPGLGEACTDRCGGGAVCSSRTSICIAPLPEGATCSTDGDPCEALLECTDGVCTRFDPATCN